MNVPVFFAVCGIAISATLAFQAWPLSRAPGWTDLRWFSLAALTAALATVCTLGSSLPVSPALVGWASRGQLFFLALHVAAWWRYVPDFLGRPLGARGQAVCWGMAAVALASLVPGLAYGPEIQSHSVPWLGASYQRMVPTPLGLLFYAAIAAVPATIAVRLAAAWRRGLPRAGILAASFAAGTAIGMHDATAVVLGLHVPYLLDVGHVLPILVVAWVNLTRHTADALALDQLRWALEEAVRARTRQLEAAQASLISAERAAAVGRFAGRLAHDMNSPVAVVAANLRYLAAELAASGELPSDTADCLSESHQAMERIGRIARQLLDAGRPATPPGGQVPAAAGEGSAAASTASSATSGR